MSEEERLKWEEIGRVAQEWIDFCEKMIRRQKNAVTREELDEIMQEAME